jgi:predicted metal-dependent HD superfamily phosphohydrolase
MKYPPYEDYKPSPILKFSDFVRTAPRAGRNCPTDIRIGYVWKALMNRYLEPHRHYHTLGHIQFGFSEYFKFFDKMSPITFFAWAYHDAVYDPTRDDNEARSAMVFEKDNPVLGFDVEDADKIIALILSTTHTEHVNLVTDIDLAGLGSSAEQYDENTRLIRMEYNFASDEMWKAGRMAFLKTFLARPQLYFSPQFAGAYTLQARENMQRELDRLCTIPS